MARIFSWHIQDESKDCFSYLATGSTGSYSAGYMVLPDKITDTGSLTAIANVVSAYTENTYKTQFNNMKQAVADCGFTVTWKDYKDYYDVDGSNLVMLTGIGEKGEQGIQGIQGVKGETGSAGKGRNIMCYCGLDSGITPTRANLSGGKFYPNKWEIEYPTDPQHICTWQDSNEFGLNKVVWMSNADFPSSTGDSPDEFVTAITKTDAQHQEYTWSTPVRISGPNGADGDNIEFVYKRAHKRTDPVPAKPTGTTESEAEAQGWTDHPLGIVGDSDNPENNWRVEYMCQHIKDPDTKQWGEFTEPILWASWGEDGNDGDGIEYIFAVTQEYTAPGNVPNKNMKLALTNGGELNLGDIWQEPEVYDYLTYCGVTKTNDGITVDADGKYFYGKTGRTDTRHASVYPWTDDPADVSADEPYEWVCIRRSKWDATNEHSVYGDFSEPILWAHWGKDGEKGNDGTSVDIRGQADTLGKLLKSLGNDVPQVGFSYAIGVDGKRVYVWMEQDSSFNVGRREYTPPMSPASWYDKSDDEIYNGYYYKKTEGGTTKYYWFTDCGSFYGEPGDSAYLHIKYATDYTGQTGVEHRVVTISGVEGTRDICFTTGGTTLGETPGKYIATYTDNIHDDRGDLAYYDGKWAKFEGEDGQSYGQEQIFFRSASMINTRSYSKKATVAEHGYDVGEWYLDVNYAGSFDKVDWVPTNWTDVPMGIINGTYNFEYVSVRRLLDDGTWSYFSEPALYNEAGDTTDFQVEYSTWTGETTPVLRNASEFTDASGNFDEDGWRAAHASTGPWSDTNSTATVWMATAQKIEKNSNSATTVWNDWQITRCKGINGKAGNGRNIMCYCSLPEGYVPTRANLSGGKFYPNLWNITYPQDYVGIQPTGQAKKYCSWGDSNEPADPSYKVWMSNADFPSSTGTSEDEAVDPIVKTDQQHQEYTWSTPVCITGENGENGADGNAIEFIYARTQGEKPDTPPQVSQEPDFLPPLYINGVYQGKTWNDHPEGIDEEWKYEWMCQRTKDEHGIWGSFSQVAQWSRWGEDGIDGDGVEYIFAVTKDLSQASVNAIKAILPSTTSNGGELAQYWQEPEIWDTIAANPTFKAHYSKQTSVFSGWTDDPADVSPDEPYEWVSIRRKQYEDSAGNAIFHEFEEPTLWARWADDGDSIFTSFAFTSRIVGDDISDYTVSGFETNTFTPTTTKNERGQDVSSQFTWTDTAPKTSNIIWMVSGVFKKHHNAKTGVDTYEQQGNWGPITRMVDTENFEVMYSPGKPISGGYDENDIERLPTGFTKTGKEITQSWLTLANAVGWYDEVDEIPAGYGAVWMAQITGSNNVFNDNDWQYMKVKGEKGADGQTPTDLDYLKQLFDPANVDQKPGALLREFLGVTDTPQGTNVVAFLNGSADVAQMDGKTLMVAAGCNGLTDANNAKFRVYSDGTMYAKEGVFEGTIQASTITANDGEGNGFTFGKDGTVEINNKNVQINNSGITYLSDEGEPVLTVQNAAYTSLTQFVNTMSGDSFSIVKGITIAIDNKTVPQTYVYGGAPTTIEYETGSTSPVVLATFTIPAGSKQRVVISPGGIILNGTILNYATTEVNLESYLCNFMYAVPIILVYPNGSEDLLDMVADNVTQAYSSNPRGPSSTYTRILSEGNYSLQIGSNLQWGNQYYQKGMVGVYANDIGYGPGLCQFNYWVQFGDLRIEGNPVNSGTEIFRNGIGVKNNANNYFFIATPDGSNPSNLILSVRSGGKGFDLIDGTWTNHGINP